MHAVEPVMALFPPQFRDWSLPSECVLTPRAVERLAREHFTYLSKTPGTSEVVIGDGRLSLERERQRNAPRYDILALDAFAGDAVPLHLLRVLPCPSYLRFPKSPPRQNPRSTRVTPTLQPRMKSVLARAGRSCQKRL